MNEHYTGLLGVKEPWQKSEVILEPDVEGVLVRIEGPAGVAPRFGAKAGTALTRAALRLELDRSHGPAWPAKDQVFSESGMAAAASSLELYKVVTGSVRSRSTTAG